MIFYEPLSSSKPCLSDKEHEERSRNLFGHESTPYLRCADPPVLSCEAQFDQTFDQNLLPWYQISESYLDRHSGLEQVQVLEALPFLPLSPLPQQLYMGTY
ncbi:hypothetical protein M5K25_000592 [Dendrobium thyrsiflorum]|uniref:Uncharacterized protein n=1 Tax=Dendrobium thyrsiflorum TaxID=117978 RepID=A0ABD0VUP7_DENTH